MIPSVSSAARGGGSTSGRKPGFASHLSPVNVTQRSHCPEGARPGAAGSAAHPMIHPRPAARASISSSSTGRPFSPLTGRSHG